MLYSAITCCFGAGNLVHVIDSSARCLVDENMYHESISTKPGEDGEHCRACPLPSPKTLSFMLYKCIAFYELKNKTITILNSNNINVD